MPNLVIVESPHKAGTIKSYLGSGYKVLASVGHVRDLPKSTLGVDIENGFEAHYINIRGKGDVIKELKKEAKAADKIFLATDPDREGEAISWHLATVLGIPMEKTRRVTFNELTKSAVKAGIKSPRTIDIDLVNSQQARRILDRIVGYKLSPFLWKTVRSGLSAGRVQSVAVKIIIDRENEINAFVPVEYWTVEVIVADENGRTLKAKFYGDKSKKIELHNEKEAMAIVNAITGKTFTVDSIKKATRLKNPLPPFTTSTMQQEASRRLAFPSAKTMKVAQELYEGIHIGSEFGGIQGLITYMRTDSQRISEEAQKAAHDYIENRYGSEYNPASPRVYKAKSGAQDAHEAIRPSNIAIEPDKIKKHLTPDQYKLYKLIWNRFTASQMASAELETVSADLECANNIFRAAGYTVKFPGYLAVYDDTDHTPDERVDHTAEDVPEKTALPPLSEGEKLDCNKISPAQHFTEPPPRYNEGSLVKFLEENGIGRPSTFASIITTIIQRGYVEREGKSLKPTQLGYVTNDLISKYFPDIVDYEFTAQMENDLDNIEHGETSVESILSRFYTGFERDLEQASKSVSEVELPAEQTDIICEKCGAKMIVKNGRYGKFAACPNYPECKNAKPLENQKQPETNNTNAKKTDMKCELCGADMVLRSGRFGSFYACSKYPTCKNTKQIQKDVGVPCPVCGGKVYARRGKKSVFYSCENYKNCKFSSWDMPVNEKCPNCSGQLYRKKGKDIIVCHNEGCNYKREIEKNTETDSDGTN